MAIADALLAAHAERAELLRATAAAYRRLLQIALAVAHEQHVAALRKDETIAALKDEIRTIRERL